LGVLSCETETLLAARAAALGETPDALVQRLLTVTERRKPDMNAVRRIVERHRTRPLLDDRPLKETRDELWGV
jgi:hypothetical protein